MPVPSRAVAAPSNAAMQYMRFPIFLVAGLLILIGLTFSTALVASAVETCVVDSGGANDISGQRDLTRMCSDPAGLPATIGIKWQWDWTGWTGGNTGDACSLYDTDGDGNANYSLCITVRSDPATYQSSRLYSCTDARTDRCSGPTQLTGTSTCSANVQGTAAVPVDPFPTGDFYPQDTVGFCTVSMSDFGNSATATLVDVCSYSSQQPNSDPADCVTYKANTGKLEVRKALNPTNDSGLFNLLIDSTVYASAVGNGGTTGERVVSSAGSHTVSESASGTTNLADYTTTIQCRDLNGTGTIVASGSSAGPLTLSVADSSDVVCTITNTRKTGTLQVTKTVNWNGISPDTSQIFQICATGPSYPTPNCQTAGYNGGTLTWSNVLPGVYNVVETDPGSAWTVSASAGSVSVAANGTGSVTITNARKLGSLAVNKVVDWNGVTPVTTKIFEICITGPSYTTANCKTAGYNGGLLTWSNLLPGSYSVAETNPGNEWAVAISSTPATVPTDGTTANVTVSNTYKRGSLTVTKVVDWQDIAVDTSQTFEICITGPSYPAGNCQIIDYQGGALNWTNLVPGAYAVGETNAGPTWTTTISGSPAAVVSGGPVASASVLNSRKLGSLQVTKTVNWNGIASDPNQTFQVCITGPSHPGSDCQTIGPNGGVLSWNGLIPGNYSVTETDPGNMWVVQLPAAAVSVPANGDTATANVTNTHKLGNLQIEKIVDWNGSTPDPAQTYQICVNGPSYPSGNCQTATYNGGPLTWSNLLPGSYAITEPSPGPQWSSTIGGTPAIVLGDGSTTTASVTNTRKRGSLTVTKVVEWNGITPDPNQTFQICISGPSYPNGNCRPVGFEGGALTWSSLVPGSYSVSESVLGSEWTVTISNVQVTVPGDGTGTSASVINSRKLGALDVTKYVQWNGVDPDENQTFEVCIKGPSFPNGDCQTVGFGGGASSWSGLIPGDYIVSETAPGSEWSVAGDGATASVPVNGGTATASITNTRKRGSLTVAKVVDWSGVSPDTTKIFQICITGPSYPGGNCLPADYDGATLQWNDLIPGSYGVTENDPGNEWTVQIAGTPAIVPADGSGAAASVTNTRKLGSLQVTKTVNWNGVPTDPNQSFTICIVGPSYTNGDCKSIGANGGTLTWGDLIPGAYAVSENSPGSAWDIVVSGTPATVPVDGSQAAASVTNTRKLGSLQVTKTVSWNGVTPDANKTFNICVTGPSYPTGDCKSADFDGSVLTWDNLIPGDYTVAEDNPGSEWQVDVAGSPAEVPVSGEQATAGVTNSRRLGSLQVTKTVNWNDITPDASKTFQICISGPSYPAPECRSVGSTGGVLTWENLIPGTYSVVEADPGAQWSVEITGAPATVPADGGSASATVTNTRKRGSLTVTKVVNWNGVPADPAQGFQVCITGPTYPSGNCKPVGANGGALTWTNLLPGQYDVSENDPGVTWTVEIDDTLAIVPATGGGGSATVTNSRRLGSLQVSKTVNWNGVTPLVGQTFQICITGPSYQSGDCKTVSYQGGQVNWSNLIPGSYNVTESFPGSEWTTQVTGTPASVPLDGGQASAAVSNTRKLGGLNVTKTVDWNGVAPDTGKTFEICINGPSFPGGNCQNADYDGGVLTWANLIPGAYALSETNPGSQWVVTLGADSINVPADGSTASAGVTNTRKRGSLTVSKVVNWNGVPVDATQKFRICITGPSFPNDDCQDVGPNGGTLNWLDLLPGVYAVSEPSPGVEWSASVNPASVTVPEDGSGTSASVINTRLLGSLTVAKTVEWNGVPVNNQASFEICITGPSYPSGNCKPVGYGGGALLWTGLVPGDYTVEEVNYGSEWTVQVSGSPATVPVDGSEAKADVVNSRKLGGLSVTKTVNWNGITPDGSQSFSICINGPSYPSGDCLPVGANGGVLQWSGLIPGDYAVTETNPGSQWAVQISGSPAAVPADGGQAAAGISNSRKLGSLQVTKTVNWNGVTPVTAKTFQICIAGPSYPSGNCQDADYDGSVLGWSNLIPGQYAVTETNPGSEWIVQLAGSPATVPVDGGQAAAAVNNTRKLGSLQVAKSVNWNGVSPDTTKSFQICITGPSHPTGSCQDADYDGAVLAWPNLIPGNYTIDETAPGSEWQVGIAGSPAAVPADGGQAAASVTNTRRLGSLQVTKTVNWNGVPVDDAQSFEICISGPSFPSGDCKTASATGAVLTWSGLVPGNYVVDETDPGSEWSRSFTGSPATVPADGGQATATVTNTRRHGSLTVTKTVNWNGAASDETQSFEVCIAGPSYPQGNCQTVGFEGGVLNWSQLLPGEYFISETDPGTAWAVAVTGSPANVPEDGTGTTAAVSNTRKLGNLQVSKTVNWNGVQVNEAQSFQICIAGPSFPAGDCQDVGPNGGILNWTNLVPGEYSVAETNPGSEWTVVTEGGTVTVPVDGSQAAASVTNTRKLGGLQVTKIVDWNGVAPSEQQSFQICIQGPTYPTGNCQVVGSSGGVLAWKDLIPGVYAIAEADPGSQWLVTLSSASVSVPEDGATASASVTNTRKHGSLTVSKVVNWNGIAVDNSQTFQICINGPSFPKGDCQNVGPNGGALNWFDLLPGVYSLVETAPGTQWSVLVTPNAVTVPEDGENVAASVVNTRRLGSLEVLKIVAWSGTSPDNQKTFQLCISGPSYPTGSCKTMSFGGGALLWSNLLPGAYSVTETNPGSAWTVQITSSPATVPLDGGQAKVTVTNTKLAPARITVTKLVSETESHQWSFVLRLDGAEAKTVTKQQPEATWENLEPNQSYILSEDKPGEAWVEGTFECSVDGVGVGELLGDGDMQLNLQPADDVVCVKHNAELSGTDEDPVDEPGRAFGLYLPAINR